MGQDIELDFDSICSVDLSPNTVLPSIPRHSSIRKRNTLRKQNHKALIVNVKDDFTEIRFGRLHRSCKSNSLRPVELESNEVPERVSMYQSSEEVGKIDDMGIQEGRRKIEISCDYETSWSNGIVDSLCSSDEEGPQKRSPVLSMNTKKLNQSPVNEHYIGPRSSDGFIEMYLDSDNDKAVLKDSSNHLANVTGVGPFDYGKEHLKRDKVHTLQKSLSEKVEMPQKQFQLESILSSRHSPKIRLGPFRRVLNPFMKSKSVRSPFSYVAETGDKTVKTNDLRRNKTYRKSLLQDFSNTTKSLDCDSHFVNNKNHHSAVSCSPVHLHGSLKLEKRHGMPFFEFSQSFPEDVYVAKMWKTGNAFKWVYTFHTRDGRKKSNASGLGLNDSCKNSLMVGQMQVTCYLSSELRDGSFDNSMVTEFVLYDTTRPRQSTASQEDCECILDPVKPPKSSDSGSKGESFSMSDRSQRESSKHQQKYTSDNRDCGFKDAYPWESSDLHPDLESAAIFMQIPLSKRESLKYKRSDKTSSKMNPVLQNLSMIEPRKDVRPDHTNSEILKVVIPISNHGLPADDSHGPSTLLDRWRLGGGCDCGGWDMGCPLLIFGTHGIQCAEKQALKEKQTFELFLQGVKDDTPALALNIVKDGQYAVDFHAKLSTLQAFSICVAILHATEACTAIQAEEKKQLLHSNSLKVLLEDEVKYVIDAVSLEEKKKRESKTLKETPPSFLLNPPFSPIARV